MDNFSEWLLIGGSILWVVMILLLCHYYYDRGLREGMDSGRRRGWEEAHRANRHKYVDNWSNKGHPSTGYQDADD